MRSQLQHTDRRTCGKGYFAIYEAVLFKKSACNEGSSELDCVHCRATDRHRWELHLGQKSSIEASTGEKAQADNRLRVSKLVDVLPAGMYLQLRRASGGR